MYISGMRTAVAQNPIETIVIGVSVLIMVFFATYHLTEAPGIWYDEGFHTQIAMNLAEQGRQLLQIAPDTFVSSSAVTSGFPLIAPVALSYKLFGVGVLEGRAVMVLYIFALALVSFLFIRSLFGTRHAAWALAVLASLPTLYGNGKSVLGEVPGLFFLVLSLLLLHKLDRANYRSVWLSLAFGVSVGVCVAAKPIFFLFPLALAVTWLVRFRSIKVPLASFVAGFAGAILPLAVWVFTQFQSSDSVAFMVSFYANPYSVDVTSSAGAGFLALFTNVTPLYVLGAMLIWAASFYVRRRAGESPATAELAAFVFCVVILLAYLRLPSWFRYFFEAMIVALLFLPYAFVRVATAVAETVRLSVGAVRYLSYGVLALAVCLQTYQLWDGSYVAEYYQGTRTAVLEEAFRSLPAGESVFIYDAPELAVLLPSRNYYQYIAPHPDYLIGSDELSHIAKGDVPYVILKTADYRAHAADFARYAPYETANRYTILKKL